MPAETGYQQQTMMRPGAQAPLADPNDFGAQIGGALINAGAQMHQNKIRAYQIDRRAKADAEVADFSVKFAEARDRLDTAAREARANAAAGGAGHVDAMRAAIEAEQKALFAGITEDSVRNNARAQFENWAVNFGQREADFAEGKRVAKVTTDFASSMDISANRVMRLTDPKDYASEVQLGYAAVDALQGVSDDDKAKLKREMVDQKLAYAFLTGLNNSNPALAKEMLDKGLFDERLEPQQIERLRSGSEVEIRRAESEVRAQQAMARTQVNQEIDLAKKQLADGVPMEDAVLEQLQAKATAAGLGTDAYDIASYRIQNNYNRVSQSWTPVQFQAEITRLQTKIANAGDKARPDDIIARDHLVTLRDKRAAQIRTNPFEYGAANGLAVGPVDFNDPGSIQARVSTAEQLAKQLGTKPVYLQPQEAEVLSQEYGKGLTGKLRAVQAISAFGGRAALEVARQIAPQDAVFHRVAVLPLPYAKLALNGAEARKANAALTKGEPEDAETFKVQDASIARALASFGATDVNAIRETAKNIAGGLIAETGDSFSPSLYWRAVNMALGATGTGANRKGGMGLWGNRAVVLPDGVSQAGFESAVMNRRAADPMAAPVNRDGSPADLRRAVPVAIGAGVYRWEAPNGDVLRTRSGKPYTLTVKAR